MAMGIDVHLCSCLYILRKLGETKMTSRHHTEPTGFASRAHQCYVPLFNSKTQLRLPVGHRKLALVDFGRMLAWMYSRCKPPCGSSPFGVVAFILRCASDCVELLLLSLRCGVTCGRWSVCHQPPLVRQFSDPDSAHGRNSEMTSREVISSSSSRIVAKLLITFGCARTLHTAAVWTAPLRSIRPTVSSPAETCGQRSFVQLLGSPRRIPVPVGQGIALSMY